tara:strand:- start:2306 stop:2905 length:600 start_codon:yes stop_codon:yes gene_type:complete
MNGRICGIDVGRVNMGISIVENGKFIFCGVASLKKKVPINDEVERLAEYLHQRFGRFAVVGIELQRTGVMKRIEIFLEKAFEKYSRATVIVAPQCVKRYYNYSGLKSYADRKRVGTEKFMALCRETGQYDSIFRKAVKGRDKLDDIADASLIAYYVYAEPSVLEKKTRKKKPMDLNAWAKERMFSISDMPVASKKRKAM